MDAAEMDTIAIAEYPTEKLKTAAFTQAINANSATLAFLAWISDRRSRSHEPRRYTPPPTAPFWCAIPTRSRGRYCTRAWISSLKWHIFAWNWG